MSVCEEWEQIPEPRHKRPRSVNLAPAETGTTAGHAGVSARRQAASERRRWSGKVHNVTAHDTDVDSESSGRSPHSSVLLRFRVWIS